jgi:hypothetical protein
MSRRRRKELETTWTWVLGSGIVVRRKRRGVRPTRPAVRINRATRLRPARWPRWRNSACTRGAPYSQRLASYISLIALVNCSSTRARAESCCFCQA